MHTYLFIKFFFCTYSGVITNHKNGITEDTVDPNAFYPELPPNHPKNARLLAFPPRSRCPVENGVIKTKYIDFIF